LRARFDGRVGDPALPVRSLPKDELAKALLGKEAPLTGDELRFLRKRIGKSSKDFAQLIGKTSEQYSRIENGAVLTASNDKLVRLMVIAMSIIGALKEPALMERVANQTWDTGTGPERRIIARVNAACEWVVETKAA
jgi:transcriptional regulator with XRE-family HTH domain